MVTQGDHAWACCVVGDDQVARDVDVGERAIPLDGGRVSAVDLHVVHHEVPMQEQVNGTGRHGLEADAC